MAAKGPKQSLMIPACLSSLLPPCVPLQEPEKNARLCVVCVRYKGWYMCLTELARGFTASGSKTQEVFSITYIAVRKFLQKSKKMCAANAAHILFTLAYCLCNSFKPTQACFRAALASAISLNIPACFLDTIALMTNRTATIIATAMMRLMITFWIRPARMKFTKETIATVAA